MRKESLNKITSAALKIFAEYGYHGATLKKITLATGLSYGLVYHYFPSKEKIFLYLVDRAFTYSKSVINKVLNMTGTAWEKIMTLSDVLADELQKKELSYYFIITQQAMTQAKDIPGIIDFIAKRIDHYKKFDKLILQAQKSGNVIDGDPGVLSAAYLALFNGLVLMMQHQEDLKNKITSEIFINLLRKN
jgi:AcrR family transcriptional regulator